MRGRLCLSAANGVVFRRILEAPPGFEPGMEVLQSHPRSFSYDPRDRESGLKWHAVIAVRESAHGAHRVWRWLKLARIGSPRAQVRAHLMRFRTSATWRRLATQAGLRAESAQQGGRQMWVGAIR
jgi:hypothetical protein